MKISAALAFRYVLASWMAVIWGELIYLVTAHSLLPALIAAAVAGAATAWAVAAAQNGGSR